MIVVTLAFLYCPHSYYPHVYMTTSLVIAKTSSNVYTYILRTLTKCLQNITTVESLLTNPPN